RFKLVRRELLRMSSTRRVPLTSVQSRLVSRRGISPPLRAAFRRAILSSPKVRTDCGQARKSTRTSTRARAPAPQIKANRQRMEARAPVAVARQETHPRKRRRVRTRKLFNEVSSRAARQEISKEVGKAFARAPRPVGGPSESIA